MTTKIEKEKSLATYSYEVYNLKGKKHIRFNSEVTYPLETVEFILKRVKEEKLKKDSMLIGIGLIIPMRPHLKIKPQIVTSSWRKNGQNK
jgi:hypothetical protein